MTDSIPTGTKPAADVESTPELVAVLAYYASPTPDCMWSDSMAPALDIAVQKELLTSGAADGKVTAAGQAILDAYTEPTTVKRGRWYPEMPTPLPYEKPDAYTDRLTGADRTNRRPYDHPRNRQCSIGYHDECTSWRAIDLDQMSTACKCPCHPLGMPAES
jgi:hypothetical protein